MKLYQHIEVLAIVAGFIFSHLPKY